MKIALLQLNATVGDFQSNKIKLLKAYNEACRQGAELAVAPELFLCGYPPRDLLLRKSFIQEGLKTLDEVSNEIGEVPLCVGYVEPNLDRPGKPFFNAVAFLHQKKIVHRIYKTLLPSYDVFEEDRYFEPKGKSTLISFAGCKIGITICEDIWNDEDFWPERLYRRDPVKELVVEGANLIINLSASPWHRGKEQTRLKMLQQVARDEKVALVQVNAVGANDELIFDGHSIALDAQGNLLALAKGFEEDLLIVDLEKRSRDDTISFAPTEQSLFSALKLGVRDYVSKSGFKSVIIGLSGGIDSSIVAVIAAAALGAEQVLGVSMPSKYSSEGSRIDAALLAKNLGIRFETISIEEPVKVMEEQLSPLFAGRLADFTEENIQSRMRGVILMALSNKFGSLVLSTGNKSEMAVGYCTLYGDMCGALSVISDVLKTEVYDLAKWINRDNEIIPASCLSKLPSAELRPNQTDQDSLPPYEILDKIIQEYLVRENGIDDLITHGIAIETIQDVITKIARNEYKRRQAAPGLKVSPRAFGMGRRFPIAQHFQT